MLGIGPGGLMHQAVCFVSVSRGQTSSVKRWLVGEQLMLELTFEVFVQRNRACGVTPSKKP